MDEVIVSVGMGPGQVSFIKKLKELGYHVAAFGKGKNSSEALTLADYTEEIDTRDFQGAIGWLNSLSVSVCAVGSYAGGRAVTTVQNLSNYFHVPTSIPHELIVGTDKIMQQKLYEKYNLSSIRTWRLRELSKDMFEEENDSQYILKPSIGRGSEGIRYLNHSELVEIINMSGSNSSEDIIQIARIGTEYRCVMIVQNGQLKLLAPIRRISYRNTVFLGTLRYSDRDIKRLEYFAEEFIQKMGLVNTILKTDIIVSDNYIDVIEMDIGVGGGSYYKQYISHLYERDMMEEYIKLITGQEVKKFVICNQDLRMDYVFNHYQMPVTYDLNTCYEELSKKFGNCLIQTNLLHPENKGGYNSNADFIFCVMHKSKVDDRLFELDEFCNRKLLHTIYGE